MKLSNSTDKYIKIQQLRKAANWLHSKTKGKYLSVAMTRNGYSQFIAYVYRIERSDKSSIWFCMDMESQWVIKKIKRICIKY